MKSTDKNLFPCERFDAERASAQLKHEQEYARKARLARRAIDECELEKLDKQSDDDAFWRVVYIFIHIAAVLLVLLTVYRYWGK